MIADYYFENMIDEPKVSDMTNIGNTLVLYGDDVTFEIKDYYEEEKILNYVETNESLGQAIVFHKIRYAYFKRIALFHFHWLRIPS